MKQFSISRFVVVTDTATTCICVRYINRVAVVAPTLCCCCCFHCCRAAAQLALSVRCSKLRTMSRDLLQINAEHRIGIKRVAAQEKVAKRRKKSATRQARTLTELMYVTRSFAMCCTLLLIEMLLCFNCRDSALANNLTDQRIAIDGPSNYEYIG